MRAQHDGRCTDCEKPYSKGDWIVFVGLAEQGHSPAAVALSAQETMQQLVAYHYLNRNSENRHVLKIVATINNRRTLILGLSRENTTRLHDNKPIAVDVQALTAALSEGPVQDIFICAGETERDLHMEWSGLIPNLPSYEEMP